VIAKALCLLCASDCKKALCLNLARRRRIWRGACISPILCGVGSCGSVIVED
jgi:hypothetical protein